MLANYDPRQWSDSAQDAFLHALHSGRLKILPSVHGSFPSSPFMVFRRDLKGNVFYTKRSTPMEKQAAIPSGFQRNGARRISTLQTCE